MSTCDMTLLLNFLLKLFCILLFVKTVQENKWLLLWNSNTGNRYSRKCQQHPQPHLHPTRVRLPVPLHLQHRSGLSFCLRTLSVAATVWTEAARVLLIEQYMNEQRSTPQEEDALSFWQKRQASYIPLAPLAEDLLSATASQACRAGLLCLWLADSRTEKPLDKESGAASDECS